MDLLAGYSLSEEENENENENNNEKVEETKNSTNTSQKNDKKENSNLGDDLLPQNNEKKKSVFKLNLPAPKKIQTNNVEKIKKIEEEEEDEEDLKAKRFRKEKENKEQQKTFFDLLPKPKNNEINDKIEEEKEQETKETLNLATEDVGPSIPMQSSDWQWYKEINEEDNLQEGSISDKYNPFEHSVSKNSNFKEISQNDLLDNSYEQKVYGQHYAQYFDRSNPYAMPSVVAKKRHQISALAYEHHANQTLMDERKSKAKQTRKEVKRKYGWL
jgi:hypothetical protein